MVPWHLVVVRSDRSRRRWHRDTPPLTPSQRLLRLALKSSRVHVSRTLRFAIAREFPIFSPGKLARFDGTSYGWVAAPVFARGSISAALAFLAATLAIFHDVALRNAKGFDGIRVIHGTKIFSPITTPGAPTAYIIGF